MTVKTFDWIQYHAQVRGNKLAFHDLHSNRKLSYSDLHQRTARLCGALQNQMNVVRGDRVAMLSNNSSDMLEIYFACARIGAICVPLNWRLTVPELQFILDDCEAKILIHENIFVDAAEALQTSCTIETLLALSASGDNAYEAALAGAEPIYDMVDQTHDDLWSIMYTSGTTGHPKGAMITHGMIFWQLANAVSPCRLSSEMVALTVMPLFHAGALHFFTSSCVHLGGSTYIMRTADAGEIIRHLSDRNKGITHFGGVPTILQSISQHHGFAAADFSSLDSVICGGAAVPLELMKLYQSEKNLIVEQIYGMTETNLTSALTRNNAMEKIGSAGAQVLHTQMKLVDETGVEITSPETVGELWVKGPNVTPGYWRREQANRDSYTDGWLHTGDAATRDADGYYFIVDRWKDMYISGGENVYPAEVEDVLYQLAEIAEVAVIGVADEKWGEIGCAVVALKPGVILAEEDILRHCDGKLARFKQPKSVWFIDELPHNATGKVLKRELRDQYRG